MLAAFGTGDDLSRRARWAEPYLQHWAPTRAAPALVLNATWVRIGNRVVFAPFEIEPENLVTLNTFAGLHSTHKWRMPPAGISLADAAVTSARFPGVLAAFETRKAGNEDRRWSFVDGGYVDASGALTAQEIFRSLDEIKPRPDIDLRLILLTDAQANADEQGTKGAELRDLIAPVVALFRVRSLLSRIAVRETIAKIDRKSLDSIGRLAHPAQVDGSSDWKVMAVELNHDDFQLELGWKLSRLTYDIVSLQLGQADLCAKAKTRAKAPRGPQSRPLPAPAPIGMPEPSEPPPDSETQPTSPPAELPESERTEKEKRDKALEVAKTIRANSCVMASIEALITKP